MAGRGLLETGKLYIHAVRRAGRDGLSMRLRLFGMLLLFLNAILMGFLLILFLTGTFHSGMQATRELLENELSYRAQNVYRSFGDISVQGVTLAGELSQSLEWHLAERGAVPAGLGEDTALLEELLGEELARLSGALEKARSSGVFLILDATVNPELEGAEHSRAGLYLKNLEPNIVSNTAANLRYMVGPMAVARERGLYTLPQWRMEFDVSDGEYYTVPMERAEECRDLPISRLYHWSRSTSLPGSGERVMLLSVPLRASDGTVMGVCGFEVSQMLFKLSYAPDNSQYEYLFCMLAPLEQGRLAAEGALFAGSYAVYPTDMTEEPLEVQPDSHAVNTYRQADAAPYVGLHREVVLYPSDSAYEGEEWVLALLMPEHALAEKLAGRNWSLMVGLGILLLCSMAVAAFISHRYVRPVMAAFRQIKAGGQGAKTHIPEIDDLIEFLSTQDEAPDPLPGQSALYQEFVKNIDTLSAAERAVFDLYMRGHTAREIAEILCLSINTIKTHNRRIYMKLNVTSRKELMVYIQMMEEAKDAYVQGKI